MAGRVILETGRLLLRAFDESDAEAFYVLGSDPEIVRYTGDPGGGLKSVEHALEILRSHPLADYAKHGHGRWACVWKETGAVIGFGEVDVGYRFLPAYWALGLATEAGRATLDYGFAQLGLARIIGLVDPANAASVRVLEKLGLRFAGMVTFGGQQVARYVIDAESPGGADG
jgi:[ribosomal protein S5]-alanine N-acetyltransferase